jgi:hypothetical protein
VLAFAQPLWQPGQRKRSKQEVPSLNLIGARRSYFLTRVLSLNRKDGWQIPRCKPMKALWTTREYIYAMARANRIERIYVVRVTNMNGALQRTWVQSDAWIVKSAIPVVPLHKVPPPKESMKEVEENRA